jgi:hypothetical protein
MATNERPFPLWVLVASLIVWSILAYAFVFLFAGGHVCAILQTVPEPGGLPVSRMTEADLAAATAARCNRPDIGAITVFGIGYIVLAAIAVRRAIWAWRARSAPGAERPA